LAMLAHALLGGERGGLLGLRARELRVGRARFRSGFLGGGVAQRALGFFARARGGERPLLRLRALLARRAQRFLRLDVAPRFERRGLVGLGARLRGRRGVPFLGRARDGKFGGGALRGFALARELGRAPFGFHSPGRTFHQRAFLLPALVRGVRGALFVLRSRFGGEQQLVLGDFVAARLV